MRRGQVLEVDGERAVVQVIVVLDCFNICLDTWFTLQDIARPCFFSYMVETIVNLHSC